MQRAARASRLRSLALLALSGCGARTELRVPLPASDALARDATQDREEPPRDGAPDAAPPCDASPLTASVVVPASANLFGAGRAAPPAPGGGGAGTLPPSARVLAGGTLRVSATGQLTCCNNVPLHGANGRPALPCESGPIASLNGVASTLGTERLFYLSGVFLAEGAAPEPAPASRSLSLDLLAPVLQPALGQAFFLGDGAGRAVLVPAGATRLYLGFQDANCFTGLPGYYGDNSGSLTVSLEERTTACP